MNKKIILIFFLLFIPLSILIPGSVCSDGWQSSSIGSRGACSHHGGVSSLPKFLLFFAFCISLYGAFYINDLLNKKKSHDVKKEDNLVLPEEKTGTLGPENQMNGSITQSSNMIKNNPVKKLSKTEKRVRCPRCRSSMRIRIAKKGKNIGNKFYGCSKFPRCRGTKELKESIPTT